MSNDDVVDSPKTILPVAVRSSSVSILSLKSQEQRNITRESLENQRDCDEISNANVRIFIISFFFFFMFQFCHSNYKNIIHITRKSLENRCCEHSIMTNTKLALRSRTQVQEHFDARSRRICGTCGWNQDQDEQHRDATS